MLLKNCNAFDVTRKQSYQSSYARQLRWGPFSAIIKGGGGAVYLHTLHIPKATTAYSILPLQGPPFRFFDAKFNIFCFVRKHVQVTF